MNELEKHIQKSIKEYFIYGGKSNKKLFCIHNFFKSKIQLGLNNLFECHSLPDKEINVQGRYYKKKVDICIKNKDLVKGVVSVKFIMSNYCQNSNNYFENLIGEMTNLRFLNIKLWFILITFDNIPYYNNKNELKKYQKMTDYDRYKKLMDNNIIDNLIIIKVSNNGLLNHPKNMSVENTEILDYQKFKIIDVYPECFESVLKSFCFKIDL